MIIFCCSPKFLISGIRKKPNYFLLKNSERLRFFFQIREAFRSIWKPSAELVVSRKFLLASTTQPAVSVFVSDLWQVENDGKCYKRLHINLRTFSHLRGQNLSSRSQTAPLYSESFRQKNYAYCFCVGILIIQKGHKLIFSIYPHMEIPIFQWILTDFFHHVNNWQFSVSKWVFEFNFPNFCTINRIFIKGRDCRNA